jgi:hypothetical protein
MVLEYVIRPALASLGFDISRADLAAQPGIVTVHVIQHLIEDDLVVADITDRNPNVFYELAIRHAIRKPYIQLIASGQQIPFNIQDIQTFIYDITDVKRIKSAVEMIQKQLAYYDSGGKVTSPVTVAIDAMIGTRTLSQFTELLKKVEDLDHSVAQTAGLSSKLEEIRSQLKDIVDKVGHASGSAPERSSAASNDEKDNRYGTGQEQQQPKRSRKEYSVSEWIDLNQRGRL